VPDGIGCTVIVAAPLDQGGRTCQHGEARHIEEIALGGRIVRWCIDCKRDGIPHDVRVEGRHANYGSGHGYSSGPPPSTAEQHGRSWRRGGVAA